MRNALIAGTMLMAACCSQPHSPEPEVEVISIFVRMDEMIPEETVELLSNVLDTLGEECPISGFVSVSFEAIEGSAWGYTSRIDDLGYAIVIDPRQPTHFIVETLIHEWAHAMVGTVHLVNPHDEIWGAAYSRAYRAVIDPVGTMTEEELHGDSESE